MTLNNVMPPWTHEIVTLRFVGAEHWNTIYIYICTDDDSYDIVKTKSQTHM